MEEKKNGAGFGIRMRDYCTAHEAFISVGLKEGRDIGALLEAHARKIAWLQHERLIHLIVTLLISIVFLFSIWLFIVLGNPYVLILTAVVLILLGAYIRHYFFLENTVQRWYTLYDRIYEDMRKYR